MSQPAAPLAKPVLNLLQGQLESLILAFLPACSLIEEQYLLSRLGLKLQTNSMVSADLAQFQQHFVLYHLLYRIQQYWLHNNTGYLNIGLAKVQLLPLSAAPECVEDGSRRGYYHNWYNFYAMTEHLLDQHLAAFWQHIANHKTSDHAVPQLQALALLELDTDFTLGQLKKAYRSKALQLHPDRGGDQQQFILLQQAYQQLLSTL